jgi:hypothetical protein
LSNEAESIKPISCNRLWSKLRQSSAELMTSAAVVDDADEAEEERFPAGLMLLV